MDKQQSSEVSKQTGIAWVCQAREFAKRLDCACFSTVVHWGEILRAKNAHFL
jgi:hypothetical protein